MSKSRIFTSYASAREYHRKNDRFDLVNSPTLKIIKGFGYICVKVVYLQSEFKVIRNESSIGH